MIVRIISAGKGRAVGLGVGSEPLLLEPGEDETVDRRLHPSSLPHLRQLRPLNRLKGPVAAILGTLVDPAGQQSRLVSGEGLANLRRRHHEVGIVACDTGDEFTGGGVTGHDRDGAAVEFSHRHRPIVETQPGLTVLGVGAVAGEAAVGEQRADVAIEIEWLRSCSCGRGKRGDRGQAVDRPRQPSSGHRKNRACHPLPPWRGFQ